MSHDSEGSSTSHSINWGVRMVGRSQWLESHGLLLVLAAGWLLSGTAAGGNRSPLCGHFLVAFWASLKYGACIAGSSIAGLKKRS